MEKQKQSLRANILFNDVMGIGLMVISLILVLIGYIKYQNAMMLGMLILPAALSLQFQLDAKRCKKELDQLIEDEKNNSQ